MSPQVLAGNISPEIRALQNESSDSDGSDDYERDEFEKTDELGETMNTGTTVSQSPAQQKNAKISYDADAKNENNEEATSQWI